MTSTASLSCTGSIQSGPAKYPGGPAWVDLPDVQSLQLALALMASSRKAGWTAYHFAGDEAYRLQGIN